ncbi:MAG: flagellar basal body protein [Actinomycetota bacterium]|nr:flagellar basal body protein [Actinomycetota bacterium]
MDWRSPDDGSFVTVLDDVASVTLSTALSALAQRQRVSANNIANIETPNFSASQVSFESSLRDAVAAGDPGQAQSSVTPTADPAGINGNNVNLDTETITDEKTQLQYSLLSGAMSAKFSLIDTVLKG